MLSAKASVRTLAMALALTMVFSAIPAFPTSASYTPGYEQTGSTDQWVFLQEDFEGYTGDVSLYNADTEKFTYSGAPSEYMDYTVRREAGNSYLDLFSKREGTVNRTPYVRTSQSISGEYTLQLGFRYPQVDNGTASMRLNINMFEGSALGTGMMMELWKDRIVVNDDGTRTDMLFSANSVAPTGVVDISTWYTVKLVRANGALCGKVWVQGQPEPSGWLFTYESARVTNDLSGSCRISLLNGDAETGRRL